MSHTTFYNIQRNLVIPVINEHFSNEMEKARNESRRVNNAVIGDGRFDSPGKSAKYCTYTCISPVTKKIVSSVTIQTRNGKGSAPLELEGFKQCHEQLLADKYHISVVATDRNQQLAKWVRTEHPQIIHKFDPWHFVKNVKSKLRPLATKKGCSVLKEWIKPIGNHLFWCSENCDGDQEKLVQMWQSLLHHITNKHKFGKVFSKYKSCAHRKYTSSESRKKKWIKRDSPAYYALEKIINNKRYLKDIPHLANPLHTGSLEVFHSLINSYAPKRQEFELNVQNARVRLAILDHNNNVNKKQATLQKTGEKRWRYVCSKLSKEWVPKAIMEKKSFAFVERIIEDVMKKKLEGEKVKVKAADMADRLISPKNIAYSKMPSKTEILQKHFERFKKI